MATTTPNVELEKLDLIDLVSRTKFNNNYDKIDNKFGEVDDALENLQESTGNLSTQVAGLAESETGKAEKSYVDENFYTKKDADAKFISISAYKDTRSLTFTSSNIEIRYPWAGTAKQIQINCSESKDSDFIFQVERQSKANYIAKANNWEKLGGQTLALPSRSVYLETDITHDIKAGDIVRYTTTATSDTNITVQVIVENTINL